MNINLKRKIFTDDSTIGEMYIDGEFFCFTLEDKVRLKKIQNVTAIPAGRYEVVINFSNRFKRYMPLLLNVPNYSGIRIHSGNTSKHTEGCILVGDIFTKDFIGNSRKTFLALMKRLRSAEKKEKIIIEIS
jgi:hypothetical protein